MAEADGPREVRGRTPAGQGAPRRIVSLVPSWTELVCWLGRAERLVGVTEYCVHPPEARERCVCIGGTKTPSIDRIRALSPDLVIANREENRKLDVERLLRAGVPVLVTEARSVRDAMHEIEQLGGLLEREQAARALTAEIAAELAAPRPQVDPVCVVALIWKAPYMAVGGDCFAHDLLVQCGARNPFASERRRYPAIAIDALVAAQPEVILLPSEPYAFGADDREELLALDTPASRHGRVALIEGELLSWYGPRIPRALRELRQLLGSPSLSEGRSSR